MCSKVFIYTRLSRNSQNTRHTACFSSLCYCALRCISHKLFSCVYITYIHRCAKRCLTKHATEKKGLTQQTTKYCATACVSHTADILTEDYLYLFLILPSAFVFIQFVVPTFGLSHHFVCNETLRSQLNGKNNRVINRCEAFDSVC